MDDELESPALPQTAPPKKKSSSNSAMNKFATFFKTYMSAAALITSSLPIGLATWSKIPVFEAQRGIFATYAPIVCFMSVAYIFYMRHSIGSVLFLHRHRRLLMSSVLNLLPALLIVGCIASMFFYQSAVQASIVEAKVMTREEARARSANSSPGDRVAVPSILEMEVGLVQYSGDYVLKTTPLERIPRGTRLMTLFILIFLTAETAFAMMAMREYLQEQLKFSDVDVIEKVSVLPAGPGCVKSNSRPSLE